MSKRVKRTIYLNAVKNIPTKYLYETAEEMLLHKHYKHVDINTLREYMNFVAQNKDTSKKINKQVYTHLYEDFVRWKNSIPQLIPIPNGTILSALTLHYLRHSNTDIDEQTREILNKIKEPNKTKKNKKTTIQNQNIEQLLNSLFTEINEINEKIKELEMSINVIKTKLDSFKAGYELDKYNILKLLGIE